MVCHVPSVVLALMPGIMNDTELHAFQSTCFNTPLPASELSGLKEVRAISCLLPDLL